MPPKCSGNGSLGRQDMPSKGPGRRLSMGPSSLETFLGVDVGLVFARVLMGGGVVPEPTAATPPTTKVWKPRLALGGVLLTVGRRGRKHGTKPKGGSPTIWAKLASPGSDFDEEWFLRRQSPSRSQTSRFPAGCGLGNRVRHCNCRRGTEVGPNLSLARPIVGRKPSRLRSPFPTPCRGAPVVSARGSPYGAETSVFSSSPPLEGVT